MIALFLVAAAATASAPLVPASQGRAHAPSASPARNVIEAQLRSPPRSSQSAGLSAEEADAIYKHYLASIGQRPDRAPDDRSGSTP